MLCQVSSYSDQKFSFRRANIHNIHLIHHDKMITLSAPPYYVVGANLALTTVTNIISYIISYHIFV